MGSVTVRGRARPRSTSVPPRGDSPHSRMAVISRYQPSPATSRPGPTLRPTVGRGRPTDPLGRGWRTTNEAMYNQLRAAPHRAADPRARPSLALFGLGHHGQVQKFTQNIENLEDSSLNTLMKTGKFTTLTITTQHTHMHTHDALPILGFASHSCAYPARAHIL